MKKYWEFWKDDEKLRIYTIRLAFFETVALVAMVILFGFTLSKYFLSPKPVYVVTTGTNGVVVPYNMQGEIVYDFTQNYLNLLYTYTPSNFADRVKEAENLALSSIYPSIEKYTSGIEQSFKTAKYSSAISFTEGNVKITLLDKNTYSINIKDASVEQFYDSITNSQKVSFDIKITKGIPSQQNPYGLYVSQVDVLQGGKNSEN